MFVFHNIFAIYELCSQSCGFVLRLFFFSFVILGASPQESGGQRRAPQSEERWPNVQEEKCGCTSGRGHFSTARTISELSCNYFNLINEGNYELYKGCIFFENKKQLIVLSSLRLPGSGRWRRLWRGSAVTVLSCSYKPPRQPGKLSSAQFMPVETCPCKMGISLSKKGRSCLTLLTHLHK